MLVIIITITALIIIIIIIASLQSKNAFVKAKLCTFVNS
jgi:hypothetical protein